MRNRATSFSNAAFSSKRSQKDMFLGDVWCFFETENAKGHRSSAFSSMLDYRLAPPIDRFEVDFDPIHGKTAFESTPNKTWSAHEVDI